MDVVVEFFHNTFQLGQPADAQVTILQQYPTTAGLLFFDHLLRSGTLSLTEGDHRSGLLLFLGELKEVSHWIRTRRQNNQQRSHLIGVLETFGEFEGRGQNVLLADGVGDPALDGRDDLVGTDDLENQDLLELVQLVVEVRDRLGLRSQ